MRRAGIDASTPIRQAPLADGPSALVGKPVDRVDGPAKVCGLAPYAYEYEGAGQSAYGYIVQSTIAKGRLTGVDTHAAEAAPGVLLVMTWKNAPRLAAKTDDNLPQLQDQQIHNYGQAVALVVAEGFEQARAAAALVRLQFQREPGGFDLAALQSQAITPPGADDADSSVGDFETAFAAAPVRVDAVYSTPHECHAMTEPHATMAEWQGEELLLHTSNQMLNDAQASLGATFAIPPEKVRVISRYVGGGFGGKLHIAPEAVLAAMAAKRLGRRVKVAMTRQQVFHLTTHRSASIQRVRLGAGRDGRLLAIGHDATSGDLPGGSYYEGSAEQTRTLYAGANRLTRHRLAPLDLPKPGSMRAPGEASGLLALECAMDELAERCGLDPVELRIRNEPTDNPETRKPFSSRMLVPCMREGARRFGWSARNPQPGQVRQGRVLVGLGMSAAIRNNYLAPSEANIRLQPDGAVRVRMAMTDIGTGTYTVMTQLAAELMGVPLAMVRVEMGDTDFPKASGSGGSIGASSCGTALYDAAVNLRAKLSAAAGYDPATARFEGGRIVSGAQSRTLVSLAGPDGVKADGKVGHNDTSKAHSQQCFGAHFAEVGVDMDTGEIRMRRMLGVFAIGRVLNEKTARSQLIGGMTFGIGAALTEEAVVDPRFGMFVNHDLAEYHVPVNADIGELDAMILPELDSLASPLKSKGCGELGICGAGAAVANAVYNACGVRIRDYPLTLDKVIAGLAAA